ncbi:MAG: UDP-3-O-(3-hydroxymyristoyl)glucosamine N-acyltransferase [Candidatus Omnitrophica bacterium]|nr:UDP-3-O-(3-hydroxymyristoyl)glucosamine N-acyltransferase [Candidatus Omnitrophota bacterium]
MRKTIKEIATIIGGIVQGDGSLSIESVASLDTPKEGAIAFVNDKKLLPEAEATKLACLIAPKDASSSKKTLILVENPKLSWAKLLGVFHPARQFEPLMSDKACIAKSAKVSQGAHIAPFAYIGERSVIGKGSVILPFAFIDDDVVIGNETIIHPNVSIYERCRIGNGVIIHSGAVIGADGFGYVVTTKGQEKIPQVGNVIVEDDVEIGACATIDRATIGSTIVKKGTKIDNLVQVAHNVEIGEHSAISAHTGISGSSKIGNRVTLAGQVGVADHCEIGDGATVGAQAGLPTGKKIPPEATYFGSPARPYEEMRKQFAAQLRIAETTEKVHQLEKKIKELEARLEELAKA